MTQYFALQTLLGDAEPTPEEVKALTYHNSLTASLNSGDIATFIHLTDMKNSAQDIDKDKFAEFAERAAGLGHPDILEYCIGHVTNRTEVASKALKTAISNEKPATVKYLIRMFSKTLNRDRFQYQFIGMLMRGNVTIATLLYKTFHYNKDILNWALVMSSCCGKINAVRWLLTQGADAIKEAKDEALWLSGKYPACLGK